MVKITTADIEGVKVSNEMNKETEMTMLEGILGVEEMLEVCQTTSFASMPPNAPREIELIQALENNPNGEEKKFKP